MSNIKFLVMDVDGTLTDGKIYMGQSGEAVKAFDIKDGCGILLELPRYGIIPVVITARKSEILSCRCRELKIHELHQGVDDKLSKLKEILARYGAPLSSVSYAGDDLLDISCMEEVKKAGGLVLCPADAIAEIKALADYVSGYEAGKGAIRDCIHFLARKQITQNMNAVVEQTISKIRLTDFSGLGVGNYHLEDNIMYSIQEYWTKDESECVLESHRGHIDIQYMLEGTEVFKTYSTHCLSALGTYDREKDAEYWRDGLVATQSILIPGSLIVVYHGQPHKGAIKNMAQGFVRKLVCKIATT